MALNLEKTLSYSDGADKLWQAVKSRDRGADGIFVFGVRSTGIYCRPSCSARRPDRSRVEFFALPEAAERQGFRPCKRCLPKQARPGAKILAAVSQVCRKIDACVANDDERAELKLGALAGQVKLSAPQLGRAFVRLLGITPRQYADAKRMRRVRLQLRKGGNVTTALYEAGFGSSSRLYERSFPHLGMTPRAYRRGGSGMQIHYTIVDCPLGRLLLAATDKGVSAIYLGDADRDLETELTKEYPSAKISREAAPKLRAWLERILLHLKGREPDLDLPTDVQATAFQRRVWEELRKIPYGSTATYAEVARRIGKPKAIRAVARACASNPVSIVVPCHRVVRADGNLAGYRWDLRRKRQLLESENENQKRS